MFLGFLTISNSNKVYAITPEFKTEAEIDAYYDALKIQNNEKYDSKIQSVLDQRDIDIANLHKKYESEKLEVYKKYFGENLTWEMIKPYFPESNPNPEAIYLDMIKSPTIGGISKMGMITFVNTDLGKKLMAINEREKVNLQKKLDIINQKISNNNSPAKAELKTQEEKSNLNTSVKNREEVKVGPTIENVSIPEPIVKLKWYQKIFNWFKGK